MHKDLSSTFPVWNISYPTGFTSTTCTHVQLFTQQDLPHPHVPMFSQLPSQFDLTHMYPCSVSYPANLTSPTCTHVQSATQPIWPHPHVPMFSQLPSQFDLIHIYPCSPMFSQLRTHMYPCSVSYPANLTSPTYTHVQSPTQPIWPHPHTPMFSQLPSQFDLTHMYPCSVIYPANLTSPTCTHAQSATQQGLPHPHAKLHATTHHKSTHCQEVHQRSLVNVSWTVRWGPCWLQCLGTFSAAWMCTQSHTLAENHTRLYSDWTLCKLDIVISVSPKKHSYLYEYKQGEQKCKRVCMCTCKCVWVYIWWWWWCVCVCVCVCVNVQNLFRGGRQYTRLHSVSYFWLWCCTQQISFLCSTRPFSK